jgi:hypothetical protein
MLESCVWLIGRHLTEFPLKKGRGPPILGPERVVCIDREFEKDTEQALSAGIMPFVFGGTNTQGPALLTAGNCESRCNPLLSSGFQQFGRRQLPVCLPLVSSTTREMVSGVPCKVYSQDSLIWRQEKISRPKSGDMASWVYEGRTPIVPVELLKGTDTRFQAGHYDSRRPAGTSRLRHTHVTIN